MATRADPKVFQDRREAGRALADAVRSRGPDDPVVLGSPRGGVPAASEVAQALDPVAEGSVSHMARPPATAERLGAVRADVARRGVAGLQGRDPRWAEVTVPLLWPALKAWFRPDVRGLERIPGEGPVLLVGNHSGGNMAPDTLVFATAFIRRFGARRPFFQLAHELVVAAPWLAPLRRYGTVTASPENARAALRAGAAVLVYPGGDWEAHRPVWQGHRIDFHDRHGFIRLALETGAPLVPVVSIGGQETALFLSRGERLVHTLRLHRRLRLDVVPISIALPWGLDVGDVFGHVPLPAKITIQVLGPIDVRARFGDDVDGAYDAIVARMQTALDGLAAERRWPVLG